VSVEESFRLLTPEGMRAVVLEAIRSPEGREAMAAAVRGEISRLRPFLMRPEEVARVYGYPVSSQRRHIREGRLKVTKIGRLTLIDVSQLAPVGAAEIAEMATRARER
jgi:hypothetical protein